MFEKFHFTQKQIDQYLAAALRDKKIAVDSATPEVIFHFCYNCLIKLGMAVCAENGLRVKSRQGHHLELIKKLAECLGDNDIQTIMDKMRQKRNWDLYGGGTVITGTEAKEYLARTEEIVALGKKYFLQKRLV